MSTNVHWRWTDYDGLSKDDLYEILKIRAEIFVVEQTSPYLDPDDRDQTAWHLIGRTDDDEFIAYLRVVAPGRRFKEASIGRVLTTEAARGRGLGRELMRVALERFDAQFPGEPVRLSGQAHLQDFYRGFGFETDSQPYDEDGIPHVEMIRRKATGN